MLWLAGTTCLLILLVWDYIYKLNKARTIMVVITYLVSSISITLRSKYFQRDWVILKNYLLKRNLISWRLLQAKIINSLLTYCSSKIILIKYQLSTKRMRLEEVNYNLRTSVQEIWLMTLLLKCCTKALPLQCH